MKYERNNYRVTKIDYSNSLNLSFHRRIELVICFHSFLILSVYLYIPAIKFSIARKSIYSIYNIVKNCDLSIALYQVIFLAFGYAIMCGVQFVPEGDEKIVPINSTLAMTEHLVTGIPVN